MSAIWLGAFAFLMAFGFDLASLGRRSVLKRVTLVLAALLFAAAFYRILQQPPLFPAPWWAVAVGIFLSLLALALSLYSLVIEIPVRRTYLAPDAADQLITTGTYALARHPAVLWFALLLIGLVIANRSVAMLVAAPVWLGLDLLYVWLQDRYLFPRQFPGYDRYRQQTPMIIPTAGSIRRCWQTCRARALPQRAATIVNAHQSWRGKNDDRSRNIS